MTTPHRSDQMSFRLPAPDQAAPPASRTAAQPFIIEIRSADGEVLVTMTEDPAGRLVIGGDESRWDEGAKRFLFSMMQWSGVVGVRWKDEVRKAASEGDW